MGGANPTGVDISKYQGVPDFSALKNGGFSFAFCKATEGVGYVDPQFNANWTGIKAAGLIRGVYHFARPDLGRSPQAEADFFLQTISNAGGLLPGDHIALDMEQGSGDLLSWTKTWLDYVASKVGWSKIWWYSYPYFITGCNLTSLTQYPLWIANAPLSPMPYLMAQTQGTVPGVGGTVDIDIFSGTLDEFLSHGIQGNGGFLMGLSDATQQAIADAVAPERGPYHTGAFTANALVTSNVFASPSQNAGVVRVLKVGEALAFDSYLYTRQDWNGEHRWGHLADSSGWVVGNAVSYFPVGPVPSAEELNPVLHLTNLVAKLAGTSVDLTPVLALKTEVDDIVARLENLKKGLHSV